MPPTKSIIITPETHWDREWYLPFQSYRAKLVLLMDRLLDLIETKNYPNFTLDGQTVPIQDYLEVRPEKEEVLKKYIAAGKISVGPMYILPDEYLVSGEALIRNFMLGIKIARKFGKYMNAAYIPDPFGHVAQLPQIVNGFDLPAVLFARGFGNEFEDLKLNIEFIWDAPGKAASTIGIHLLEGYGSVATLSERKDKDGKYTDAITRIERVVQSLASHSITDSVILNNGSDHLFAQTHIPDVVTQWNSSHDTQMIQADFAAYVARVIPFANQMKHFCGELHGGKYQNILSGVFSARMWIKQQNYMVQTLLERYTEPTSILNYLLTKKKFPYPSGGLWHAWQELLRNHPHDSICGCSIDEVHDIDMKARFFNAEMLGEEILKENLYQLSSAVKMDDLGGERIGLLVFNPLPWVRTDRVTLKLICPGGENFDQSLIDELVVKDEAGTEMVVDAGPFDYMPMIDMYDMETIKLEFIARDVPALGYKVFYLYPGETPSENAPKPVLGAGENWMENKYYKISFHSNGSFDLLDKETGTSYYRLGVIEDGGDWGDEYDYSGPRKDQIDTVLFSNSGDAEIEIDQGLTSVSAQISLDLDIPAGLEEDKTRSKRCEETISHEFAIQITLPADQKLIYIKINWTNAAADHRVRILFPTGLVANEVEADGHFYVIPRSVKPPNDADWQQKFVPTHHQHKFVTVSDGKTNLTVLNKGLPEYEAIPLADGSVTFAITLLRCIEWLSRHDLATRGGNAGPSLLTPGAQCMGPIECELALTTNKGRWTDSNLYWKCEEYHAPLQAAVPDSIGTAYRLLDTVSLTLATAGKSVQYDRTNDLPAEFGLLALNNPKITLTACKKAETGDALIIRLLNLVDSSQECELTSGLPIKGATVVNYNEETPKTAVKANVKLDGQKLHVILQPYVLATIKIDL
jgi:mannosylglycerate hydrolase